MAEIRLTDKEFLDALRHGLGLYERTAKYIRGKYEIGYSRQAVENRAKNFPEELRSIREMNKDRAEEVIHSLMLNSTNESIKLKAAMSYLQGPAKDRGYITKTEVDYNEGITINVIDELEGDED